MSEEKTNANATPATDASNDEGVTVESAIDLAKRAFALRQYEQACQHYATALELQTKKYGEDALENADLYFSYGRALLENAISQSGVLGGKGPAEEPEPEPTASGSGSRAGGPILSFSGDAEEEEEEEDPAVDLFAQAAKDVEEAKEDHEDEEDVGEPEDDFNAAWEILEIARNLYDKAKDEDDEIKLKLADTYITLGDVSLETEKFDQAITDFEAGASLKDALLPLSSRQIAEAHYKLSIVLDATPGRLRDAVVHLETALESVNARLADARLGLSGQVKVEPAKPDPKGKGKAVGGKLQRDAPFKDMSKAQIEAEVKDLEELREDLLVKLEEVKSAPDEAQESAPEAVAKALDKELNAASSTSVSPNVVNDLTSVVKKKRKAPAPEPATQEANGNTTKRKAEDEVGGSPGSEKKARLED